MAEARSVEPSDDPLRRPPAGLLLADTERLRFARWLADTGRLSDWRAAEPPRRPPIPR